MNKNCIHCDIEFDINSPEKKRAGGKINECPDCSVETEVKVLGLKSGDGKQASISILKFSSKEEKEAYANYWRIASGMTKGKECQMNNAQTVPKVSFKIVTQEGSRNHKGKL